MNQTLKVHLLYFKCDERAATTYLNGQTQGVEDDEDEHDVLEAGGVDHIPELVLVGVFGDVASQGASFKSVLHALTLPWWLGEKVGAKINKRTTDNRFIILPLKDFPFLIRIVNKNQRTFNQIEAQADCRHSTAGNFLERKTSCICSTHFLLWETLKRKEEWQLKLKKCIFSSYL